MAEPTTTVQLDLRRSRVALLLRFCLPLDLVLHQVHAIISSASK